jgi:hypothetical protein
VSQLQFGGVLRRENLLPPTGFDLRTVQPLERGYTDNDFMAADEKRGLEFKYLHLLTHCTYKTDSYIRA